MQGAFKVALAMVIAGWASMALGWSDTKWALFSVAFCFLNTGGETLAKGLMRLAGTVIGVVLSLTFLALFAQDRWAYAAAVSIWLFICGWFLSGNSRIWYTWFVGAFLVILMTEYSQLDSRAAFDIAMVRLQQTMLGIGIYTLVEILIFPASTRDQFKADLAARIAQVGRIFPSLADAFLSAPEDATKPEDIRDLRQSVTQLRIMLGARLDGAAVDSFDILENYGAWRDAVLELEALIEGLLNWRLGFANLQQDEIQPLAAGLAAVHDEISRRLQVAGDLLGGAASFEPARDIPIPSARPRRAGEDPFALAALEVSLGALAEIERASRALLFAVAEGQGMAPGERPPRRPHQEPPASIIPDPERLAIALRVPVTFLCAFAIFIYFPNLPAVSTVLVLAAQMPLSICRMPTAPVKVVAIMGMAMMLLGAGLHIFVLPHLTSYTQLAAVLFLVSFAITYLFYEPHLATARTLGFGMTVILLQLDNNQTYNFLFTANMVVGFLVPFALLWLTAMLPVSFRAEHAFRRLFRRYLGSFLWLLNWMTRDRGVRESWWQRQLRNYHLRSINAILPWLSNWLQVIPDSMLPKEGRGRMQDLLTTMAAMSQRITRVDMISRSAGFHESHANMLPEIAQWRDELIRICRTLRDSPDTLTPDPQDGTGAELARITALAHEILRRFGAQFSDDDSRDLLRELAALRGLTRAVTSLVPPASGIDWTRLNDARL
ncbi:FUSC family protein [Paracoccus halophilus]|nr:FUSC family protein [Paracoccus halophilus]